MKLIITQTDKNAEYTVRNSIAADNVTQEDFDFLRQVIGYFFDKNESGEMQKEVVATKLDDQFETEKTLVVPTQETVPADFLTNDKYWQQPSGTKGLLILDCPACDNHFSAFLKNEQSSVQCKCGADIPLDADLARFSYTCKDCGKTQYGKTNSQDATIISRCVCKSENMLQWDKEARQYVAL